MTLFDDVDRQERFSYGRSAEFRGQFMAVQGIRLSRRGVRRLGLLAAVVVVAGLALVLVGASGLGNF